MISFFLFIALIIQGQEPKTQRLPMPDLETCTGAVADFLKEAVPQIQPGTILQVSCAVVKAPDGPRT